MIAIAPHLDRLLARLPGAKPRGSGFRALCPGHDDHDPSLDVDLGDDGRILLICRSHNCSAESIVNEIGLELRDLFPDDGKRSNGHVPPPPPRAKQDDKPTYDSPEAYASTLQNVTRVFAYRDADGQHVYSAFRLAPPRGRKLFLPVHRQADGRWIGKHMPAPRMLYRLPELLAAKLDDVVVVLEGEGCVEAAVALGYVATTSAAGAKAADRTDWSPMRGRTVIVMPDADDDGAGYANDVVRLTRAAGVAHVRVLHLPGLKPGSGEDLVDWVTMKEREGRDRDDVAEELAMLVEAIMSDTSASAEPTAEQGADTERTSEPPWPAPLGEAAYHGLLGEFLRLVTPETEADPAAILGTMLTFVGSSLNRGPHFVVSGDRHHCNLFAAIVGSTSIGRKGMSSAYPRQLMGHADPIWTANCLPSGGLSTGEGLIHAVRDRSVIGKKPKTGELIHDEGVTDKRLCIIESELARTFHALMRDGNTLGAVLCQAWDGNQLRSMTKTPYCATGAHASVVAHVTAAELIERLQRLQNSVGTGGLGNRFLWLLARRQQALPFGGRSLDVELRELGERFGLAISEGRKRTDNMIFAPSARSTWASAYPNLTATRHGLFGSMTARAAAQVRRVATIYALLDRAREVSDVHLEAGLEVWRFCSDSAKQLFGESTGDKVADRILGELRGIFPDRLTREKIGKLLGWNVAADRVNKALALLAQLGVARRDRTRTGKPGRPAEEWVAVVDDAK